MISFPRLFRYLRPDDETMPIVLIGMMVCLILVPLPPMLMDIAICLNMAASFLLVIVVLRSAGHASLPVFPTLILLATLFRLSLNIGTTRLILADGDAGRVIEAFGRFVAGDNVAVGIVVFIILTIVQFVVIAKGAERVAEVAARFNLDAMPGKQMSIDAELRSGVLDQSEAQRRRGALDQESQFYGAMDGAMKFVKGDAIAGIVIALVNVGGGFAVGLLQKGMSAGEAAGTYSILSIGDGLVTQIPSLLVSVAAGIVVTRVGGGSEISGLGASMIKDLSRNRAAFVSTGVLLALISLAPGLPPAPFLLIGASAIAYGIVRPNKDGNAGHSGDPNAVLKPENPAVTIADPILLEMDRTLFSDAAAHDALKAGIAGIRRKVSERYGIKVPGIGVALSDFGDGRITARLRGAPMFSISVNGRTCLFILQKRPSIEGLKFLPGPDESILAAAVEPLHQDLQKEAARKTGPLEFALAAIEGSIVRHLPDLVGIQEAHEMLEELQIRSPVLIRETIPRILPYPKLVEVLKRLLEERVPVKDLRSILETAAACGPGEGIGPLVETVRGTLRRTVCDSAAGTSGTMDVVLVDRTLEAALSDGIGSPDNGQYPAVSPETAKAVITSIKLAAAGCNGGDAHALVIDSRYRRLLRKIIEYEMPGLRVLSYQELVPGMDIRPVGRAVLSA